SNAQTATTLASTSPAPQAAQMPWLWIGLGVLALALLAWWMMSRRSGARDASRSFLAAVPASETRADESGAPDVAAVPANEAPRVDPAAAMVASGWASPSTRDTAVADDATPPWHAD